MYNNEVKISIGFHVTKSVKRHILDSVLLNFPSLRQMNELVELKVFLLVYKGTTN